MKTFISENAKKQKKTETKRAIIGPGQAKKPTGPKSNDDILGLDLLGTGSQHQGGSTSEQKLPQVSSITFDQLLGNAPSSSSNQQQQQKGFMGGDLI